MIKKPLFREMFYMLFIVAALNVLAIKFYLYWSLKEFDSLVHFLGGACVSLIFVWLFFYSGLFAPKDRSLKNFLVVSILGVIFVGILWEIYEILVGATDVSDSEYAFDTSLDIVMDTLGALSACFYAYIREIDISFKDKINNLANPNNSDNPLNNYNEQNQRT